jgi:hypothetical protein
MESGFKVFRHPITSIDYYELQKHEVIKLASESNPGQTFFNIMLAAFSIAVTSGLTLLTIPKTSLEIWELFLFMLLAIFCGGSGFIFLYLWLSARKKQKPFLDEVLARPIQGPIGDETKELSSIESRELPESKSKMEGR